MSICFFVSDLHGHRDRYQVLFSAIEREKPGGVFIGGDILGGSAFAFHELEGSERGLFEETVLAGFRRLKRGMGLTYPAVYLIPGNDDPGATIMPAIQQGEEEGLWLGAHNRRMQFVDCQVIGYACVPPTPFLLKDWEKYDVGRSVEPGSVSPEEGWHTIDVEESEKQFGTIAQDLERLTNGSDLAKTIMLFHAPPYGTNLDRAALDGKMVEHVALDVHVGSIAIKRFLEDRQPMISLHGHIHESARLTGSWLERIGKTVALSAAHDGRELALVRFEPGEPDCATRMLIL